MKRIWKKGAKIIGGNLEAAKKVAVSYRIELEKATRIRTNYGGKRELAGAEEDSGRED